MSFGIIRGNGRGEQKIIEGGGWGWGDWSVWSRWVGVELGLGDSNKGGSYKGDSYKGDSYKGDSYKGK